MARHAVRESQEEIKQGDDPGLRDAIGDDLRIAVKGGDQIRGKEIDADAHQFGDAHGTEDAEACAFFGAFILTGAQVLADEGGHGHSETGDRQESESFDFGIGTAACHGHFPEAIDIRLDDHICYRDDGILQAGRKAVLNDLFQIEAVKGQPVPMYPVFLRASAKMDDAEDSAYELGDDGGECCASNSHVENAHK